MKLDEYTIYARLQPFLIALFPLFLFYFSFFPINETGWGLLISILSFIGIFSLLSQFSRDFGMRAELKLYRKWKIKPTLMMLSHSKSSIETITLNQIHKKLVALTGIGAEVDTTMETQNPKQAYAVYQYWIDYLREQTRDKKEFELVHLENINYGFRRNMYGLKYISLALCLVLLITKLLFIGLPASVTDYSALIALINSMNAFDKIFILTDLIFIITWLFIRDNWVLYGANSYSERLLFCCLKEKLG